MHCRICTLENTNDVAFSIAVTMCVPEKYAMECKKMMEDSRTHNFPIICISGQDRYDCIERVGRKEADIVAVDPEDMYLAAKSKEAEQAKYSVVEQVISDRSECLFLIIRAKEWTTKLN